MKRTIKPLVDRFWEKVKKTNDCWLWTAGLSPYGYGQLAITSQDKIRAHRASWIIHNGEIPDGLFVLHKCDNRACVNPSHLFLGTAKDNSADMVAKNRQGRPHGELNGRSKLSAAAVGIIKRLASGGIPQTELASSFNVTRKAINHIVRGRRWTHLAHEQTGKD